MTDRSFGSTASISDDVPQQNVNAVLGFLNGVGASDPVPDHFETKDFHSFLNRGILNPLNVLRGRVSCLVSVKPAFTNFFGGFHEGAVASVAEAVAIATARTVVAEDKELFLGELSISYLSTAPTNNNVGGFHGGAIAAVAEAVAIATARTVVADDKELFLGELSISYLSAAPKNAEVIVDASVVRSGRNLTVIAQEFKIKKTGNLVYTARATFYHMPVSKL